MNTATELVIGTKMPDGSIYAGTSPDTGRPMYATPKDASLTGTFDQAAKHAKRLDAHGHRDWRVPSRTELNVLFHNRAAIGGFDTSGLYPAGWYWASSPSIVGDVWAQRFNDGLQDNVISFFHSALRCVRG